MKKCFVIGLIMAMVPNMGVFAAQKTVDMLIAEKQAKMKKLEKCKGTTKGLKIAGLSTLGLTAVGVAGNIAEAVVLDDYKGKVKKEKEEYTKQSNLKTKLEAEAKAKAEQAAQQEAQRQKFAAICGGLSGTVQNINSKDWCVRTVTESVVSDKIADTIKSVDESCKNVQYNSSNDDGNLYTANCKDIDMIFNFTNVTCSSDTQEFKDGKCADKEKSEESKEGSKEEGKGEEDKNKPGDKDGKNGKGGKDAQPKPKTCKELYPNGSDERLACCAAGNKTTWSGDETTGICKCNDNTKEWKNGTCVAKSAPKTCTPACSANQTCENGKCVDKTTDKCSAFGKACSDAGYKYKEGDGCLIGESRNRNQLAIKENVEDALKLAFKNIKGVKCEEPVFQTTNAIAKCSFDNYQSGCTDIYYVYEGYITQKKALEDKRKIEEQEKEAGRKERLSEIDDNTKINYVCRNLKQEQGVTVNTDGRASYCADVNSESDCTELNNKLQNQYPKTARFEWKTLNFTSSTDNVYTYNDTITGMGTHNSQTRQETKCWLVR